MRADLAAEIRFEVRTCSAHHVLPASLLQKRWSLFVVLRELPSMSLWAKQCLHHKPAGGPLLETQGLQSATSTAAAC